VSLLAPKDTKFQAEIANFPYQLSVTVGTFKFATGSAIEMNERSLLAITPVQTTIVQLVTVSSFPNEISFIQQNRQKVNQI
jgi:hypothetical protein